MGFLLKSNEIEVENHFNGAFPVSIRLNRYILVVVFRTSVYNNGLFAVAHDPRSIFICFGPKDACHFLSTVRTEKRS
jgi:hypothetical protein